MSGERADVVGTPGSKTVQVYIDGKAIGEFQREVAAVDRKIKGLVRRSITMTRIYTANAAIIENFHRLSRRALRPAPDWLRGDVSWPFPTWRPLARPYDWRFDNEQ